ncbi:MAG: LytTR family transcriptional regulator DNA-binding domain-containing protein [Bacteroidetes bacterium]|nr:LytTR family transcriptional regulator DNA-binding domain-containing protein [Bacteroidota bacterium]
MKINAIIIEDEAPARALVKKFLEETPEIELKGEFSDGFTGLKAINELKPDLLFLDIQLPKLTGFEILELADHRPEIVFTTAYDEYAIKAFEMSAADYLLKPFGRDRFREAIAKAVERIRFRSEHRDWSAILQARDDQDEILSRITVRSGKKIVIVPTDKIVYLEAYDDYVKIHSASGKYLKEKPLRFYESHLDPQQFVRIHRSYLLNVGMLDRIDIYKKNSHIAILKNGEKLKVSGNGYSVLRKALKI